MHAAPRGAAAARRRQPSLLYIGGAPCAVRARSQSVTVGFLRSIPLPSADWTTSLGLFGGKNLDQSKPPICGHRVIYILYYRWAVPSSTTTTYYRLLTTYHHYHFWGPHSHQLHQRANSTAIETTNILNTVPRRFSFEKN